MYAVACLISTHKVEQALQHIPVVCWITHQYYSVNSLNSSLTSLLFNLFQNALFTFVCAVCCAQHNMEGWLCTEHKNSSEFASVTLCEFISGRHVCNYSVNLKLGSVLFFFFLGHMELSHPVMAYFAIGNYRVGSSLVSAHTRTYARTHTSTHTHFFLCPLVLFTALLLNRLLCVTPVDQQRESALQTQSSGLSVKHLPSKVSLVHVFCMVTT